MMVRLFVQAMLCSALDMQTFLHAAVATTLPDCHVPTALPCVPQDAEPFTGLSGTPNGARDMAAYRYLLATIGQQHLNLSKLRDWKPDGNKKSDCSVLGGSLARVRMWQ